MATVVLDARLQQRHDTATSWKTKNPVLLKGEIGIEDNTGRIKIGNGGSWIETEYIGVVTLFGQDTRSENKLPKDYLAMGFGCVVELKTCAVIGLVTTAQFAQVQTMIPPIGTDYPIQLAFSSSGTYSRIGVSNTAWGAWKRAFIN